MNVVDLLANQRHFGIIAEQANYLEIAAKNKSMTVNDRVLTRESL